MTGQSHFMLIFWLRKVTLRGHINSAPLTRRRVCPPPPPRTKGGGTKKPAGVGGGSPIGRLEKKPSTELCAVYKRNIKSAANECHCTVYSVHRNHLEWLCGIESTPYLECTPSNQLRKVTLRGHTNSVAWMYAIGPKNPLAKLRTFIVRSCCDRVHSWYGVDVTA